MMKFFQKRWHIFLIVFLIGGFIFYKNSSGSSPVEEALDRLKVTNIILWRQALKGIEKFGKNEIKEGKKISPFQILLNQFKSLVIWILIAATIISAFIGIYHDKEALIDAYVILAILVLIGILGFIQEYRAEKAIDALKEYTWPGNVRELENILRRAVLLSPNPVLSPDDLALPQKRQAKESLEDIIYNRLEGFINNINTHL